MAEIAASRLLSSLSPLKKEREKEERVDRSKNGLVDERG
jgi:hypothetical protein